MKAYIDLCEHLGVPPKFLLLAWAIGFSGCAVGGFLVVLERYAVLQLPSFALAFVPHFVVGIRARGSAIERFGKIMTGAFLCIAFVFFPGGALGALLAQWLK